MEKAGAIREVTIILGGWSLSEPPKLITPDITIYNAAPPSRSRLLIYALMLRAILSFPLLSVSHLQNKGKLLSHNRLVGYEQNRPNDLPE